jgi:hypothetical protein
VNTFLTTVVLWLAANFGLPAIHEHPRVEFLPPSKIFALRYKGLVGSQLRDNAVPPVDGQRETVAVYDDALRTIYLPEGWTGHTPAETSIVVHEMVHHLQNLGKEKFECPQQREKIAYQAQERWLRLFGSDLLKEFEIDPFTVVTITGCYH